MFSAVLLCSVVRDEALGVAGFGRLPVFICGISLGGCIAFNAVLADQAAGEGLIQCVGLSMPHIVTVAAQLLLLFEVMINVMLLPGCTVPSGLRRVACLHRALFAGCLTERRTMCPPCCPRRGTVLMAPMLSLEKVSRKGLNPYLRPIANLLSKLVPTAAIVATERNTLYPNIQVGRHGGAGAGAQRHWLLLGWQCSCSFTGGSKLSRLI